MNLVQSTSHATFLPKKIHSDSSEKEEKKIPFHKVTNKPNQSSNSFKVRCISQVKLLYNSNEWYVIAGTITGITLSVRELISAGISKSSLHQAIIKKMGGVAEGALDRFVTTILSSTPTIAFQATGFIGLIFSSAITTVGLEAINIKSRFLGTTITTTLTTAMAREIIGNSALTWGGIGAGIGVYLLKKFKWI